MARLEAFFWSFGPIGLASSQAKNQNKMTENFFKKYKPTER